MEYVVSEKSAKQIKHTFTQVDVVLHNTYLYDVSWGKFWGGGEAMIDGVKGW